VACSVMPSPAMMKENSAILRQAQSGRTDGAASRTCEKGAQRGHPRSCRPPPSAVSAPTASQWRATSAGIDGMPTETKEHGGEHVPARARRGARLASPPRNSATSDPARKARARSSSRRPVQQCDGEADPDGSRPGSSRVGSSEHARMLGARPSADRDERDEECHEPGDRGTTGRRRAPSRRDRVRTAIRQDGDQVFAISTPTTNSRSVRYPCRRMPSQ